MDASRTGRLCRKSTTLPSRGNLIQVLWLLDNVSSADRAEWCVADVLYVEQNRCGDVLGRGYIRYPAISGLYEEQLDHVQFLADNLLRCATPDCDIGSDDGGRQERRESSDVPKMSWRFALINREQGESDSEDDSWVESCTVGKRRKRKALQDSTQAGCSSLGDDMLQLRKRYTYVQIELERVKRQMTDILSKVSRMEEPPTRVLDKEVQRMLSRLRNRIGLKFQSPVRNSSIIRSRSSMSDINSQDGGLQGAVDGVQKACWRIRVECDLDQFEVIARIVQTSEEMQKRIRFFPEYCHTQCPSRASMEYRIVLPTFFDICAILDIGSFSDRLEMMRKCCRTQQSTVVRLVGTYVYDEKRDTGPCYINVGSSGVFCSECYEYMDKIAAGQNKDSHVNDQTEPGDIGGTGVCTHAMNDSIPILRRSTRSWDLVDGRFLSPLRAQRGKACLGEDPRDMSDTEAGTQLFQIIWRRASDLSSRMWSTDLSTSCAIHGILEIVIPYIQLHGEMLCAEFACAATDDLLSSVASNIREDPFESK